MTFKFLFDLSMINLITAQIELNVKVLNRRKVRFEPDGTFDSPTESCAHRQCKWSADSEQVYIRWGNDGVHWVKPSMNQVLILFLDASASFLLCPHAWESV